MTAANGATKESAMQPAEESTPRSKRVRPYSLTGGRTHTQQHLLVETLISTPQYDPALSDSLMPESRTLYERARSQASIAELSVELGLPLGVIRVLVGDLATRGAIFVHPTAYAYQNDTHVLERILDGLKRLPV